MHYTPDRCSRPAKIHQQADLLPSGFEIVQTLSGMDILQTLDGFHLHDDTACHQEIGNEFSNQYVPITNFHPVLLGDFKTNLSQLNSQGIFVNLFKESRTEDVAHLMNGPDDLFRNLIQP